MDLADDAQETEQRVRDIALRAMARAQPRGESATHCQGWRCGEPIPEERRQALPGVQLCITCAEIQEQRNRRAA